MFFDMLQTKIQSFAEIDEMSIKANLFHNTAAHRIVGLQDDCKNERLLKCASVVMVPRLFSTKLLFFSRNMYCRHLKIHSVSGSKKTVAKKFWSKVVCSHYWVK